MLTLNYFVRKRADVSREQFREFWLKEHFERRRPVIREIGVKKYVKCETLHDDPANGLLRGIYGTPEDTYDFVDQWVIGDLADMKRGLTLENVREAIQGWAKEESPFVDFSRSDIWMTVDVPQLFPRNDIEASWENTYLKAIMVASYRPELTMTGAQLHWNACHGALARQFASFLPYDKYIQAHRLESAVLDDLKGLMGAAFEERLCVMGQAEVWMDRRAAANLSGPEADRMMQMLVEDISLFVQLENAHLFAGKEHVMHSEPIITPPLPKLFSAD
jgi:hypothetical protein